MVDGKGVAAQGFTTNSRGDGVSDDAERLFEQALALESNERRRFIESACRVNPQLRNELISLLGEAEEADQFFGKLKDAVFSGSTSGYFADAEPVQADLNEGDVVAHYRIISIIGSGGM